ncbi:aldose epimerase [Mycolicibacterium celeriflavum]|uniref:aldose 1-epimerase n=1 Tax=Mycolicibacterium celeriflavum TaxID=1249101 RepID=UPI000801F222|nr:aldose 1-epimerase [Mycolicibacterium celeriflavum]OBG17659.1 aldose epimerase [Mycolicibacterium celeriflavum]
MADFETVTLRDPSSALTASFVPSAGMVGTSLADGGDEFLSQRRGLTAYVNNGKTMGIPILYPWANRLSANTYEVDGTIVSLTPGTGGVRTDEHGAPIHGVLAGYPGWRVSAQTENSLTAVLDYGGDPQLLAAFPFPHLLTQHVTLDDRTLTIETTVAPTTSAPVPLCFGYHPYLRIPGVAREEWALSTPTLRHLPVDDNGIPTGAQAPWPARTEQQLKITAYDDGFDRVPAGAVFTLTGGDHRIDVTFESGYPAAQLFAPTNDDLIAIEPMAAPTDALRRGGYRKAAPGKPETARFSITVR